MRPLSAGMLNVFAVFFDIGGIVPSSNTGAPWIFAGSERSTDWMTPAQRMTLAHRPRRRIDLNLRRFAPKAHRPGVASSHAADDQHKELASRSKNICPLHHSAAWRDAPPSNG